MAQGTFEWSEEEQGGIIFSRDVAGWVSEWEAIWSDVDSDPLKNKVTPNCIRTEFLHNPGRPLIWLLTTHVNTPTLYVGHFSSLSDNLDLTFVSWLVLANLPNSNISYMEKASPNKHVQFNNSLLRFWLQGMQRKTLSVPVRFSVFVPLIWPAVTSQKQGEPK